MDQLDLTDGVQPRRGDDRKFPDLTTEGVTVIVRGSNTTKAWLARLREPEPNCQWDLGRSFINAKASEGFDKCFLVKRDGIYEANTYKKGGSGFKRIYFRVEGERVEVLQGKFMAKKALGLLMPDGSTRNTYKRSSGPLQTTQGMKRTSHIKPIRLPEKPQKPIDVLKRPSRWV